MAEDGFTERRLLRKEVLDLYAYVCSNLCDKVNWGLSNTLIHIPDPHLFCLGDAKFFGLPSNLSEFINLLKSYGFIEIPVKRGRGFHHPHFQKNEPKQLFRVQKIIEKEENDIHNEEIRLRRTWIEWW